MNLLNGVVGGEDGGGTRRERERKREREGQFRVVSKVKKVI